MKKKVIAVIAVLALVVLVRSCLLPVTVSGTSMESTLQDGEFAIMSRDFSVIKRFDIVVLSSETLKVLRNKRKEKWKVHFLLIILKSLLKRENTMC